DQVGGKFITSYGMLTEALRRRRVEAGEADRFVERLLGLELTQAVYDRGAAFVEGVVERAGPEGLARVWEGEQVLPSPPEVDAPGLWRARIELLDDGAAGRRARRYCSFVGSMTTGPRGRSSSSASSSSSAGGPAGSTGGAAGAAVSVGATATAPRPPPAVPGAPAVSSGPGANPWRRRRRRAVMTCVGLRRCGSSPRSSRRSEAR